MDRITVISRLDDNIPRKKPDKRPPKPREQEKEKPKPNPEHRIDTTA